MSCIDDVQFLLRYYEKIHYDKSKMATKIKELVHSDIVSKKSIDIIIITCEIAQLYDLLDDNLVKTLKKEKADSIATLNKLAEIDNPRFTRTTPILPKILKAEPIKMDPCSSGYSGRNRGGC